MGGHNSKYKLTGKEEKIKAMLEAGTSKAEMARKLKVSRNTLAAFLNRKQDRDSFQLIKVICLLFVIRRNKASDRLFLLKISVLA